jgi:lactoylglutathione lyase
MLAGRETKASGRFKRIGRIMKIDLSFDHISIYVHDLAASAQFYSEILGLREIENKTRRPEIRWFDFDGARAIHLISKSADKPPERPINSHFALATSKFDEAVRFLNEKSVTFTNARAEPGKIGFRADGVRQIYFQDPDNYWIEINETQS